MLSKISALHIYSLKKCILLAVVYAEIISQPLLAMTTILLKMTAKDTLLWFSASFVMHFLYGVVLGAIISCGFRSVLANHWRGCTNTGQKDQLPDERKAQ